MAKRAAAASTWPPCSYEVAPNARISIEPGAGTEVFGEETDMRRMFHMLVNQDSSPTAQTGPSEVEIRRQGEWVKIGVQLGPDTAATADVERRWLSRMATRYGGWVELEGGTQSIFLPADGASDQREVVELRKELEQAQQLGKPMRVSSRQSSPPAICAAKSHPPPPQNQGWIAWNYCKTPPLPCSAYSVIGLDDARRHDRASRSNSVSKSAARPELSRRITVGTELLGDLGLLTGMRFDREREAHRRDRARA